MAPPQQGQGLTQVRQREHQKRLFWQSQWRRQQQSAQMALGRRESMGRLKEQQEVEEEEEVHILCVCVVVSGDSMLQWLC
jgi:hypothetical protein